MVTVYIPRGLCDKLRTEQDKPIASDDYLLGRKRCYYLSSYKSENICYDPRFTKDMKEGCVLAFYSKFLGKVEIHGDNKFRFSPKQGVPIYRYEGTYINYKETDFLKWFGLEYRLKQL